MFYGATQGAPKQGSRHNSTKIVAGMWYGGHRQTRSQLGGCLSLAHLVRCGLDDAPQFHQTSFSATLG